MAGKKRKSSPTGGRAKAAAVDDGDDVPARGLGSLKVDGEEGMGEFEDQWEDEFEEEEDVHYNEASEDDEDDIPGAGKADGADGEAMEGVEGPSGSRSPSPTPYLPHLDGKAEQDEELVADPSTYQMLHKLRTRWPALSFDVLRDDLGEERRLFPHSACLVAGTQAESGYVDEDELFVMKWDSLCRTQKDGDASSDDDDDGDDEAEDEATMTYRTIPHKGGVNRVRAQRLAGPLSGAAPRPPSSYHVATFADTGKVHIFDVAPHLLSLEHPESSAAATLPKKPAFTVDSHGRAEGYALDWGPPAGSSSSMRLLSGDIHSKIFLTTLTPSKITPSPVPFASHTSSVEDLQWSPNELTVFASCSADQSIRIWDVRVKDRKSVIAVPGAHPSDINVISWNAKTNYLILSGGDEGGLKVWDLRSFKGSKGPDPTPVASFAWHRAPVTSVEWHPTEESCFAASSADDQVTLWDLSVEADEEERPTSDADAARLKTVPPQLLFSHQGQRDVKEIHWHPQIPGTVISTAGDGFNIFKTISV